MINTAIYSISIFVGLFGIGISIWSFINTRNKYYHDYLKRKGKI